MNNESTPRESRYKIVFGHYSWTHIWGAAGLVVGILGLVGGVKYFTGDEEQPTSGLCKPEKTEKFNAYLQPTMTGTTIKAEFAIKNTTNEPLLLAADYDTPAALSDNKFALATTARTAPTGIRSLSQFLHGPAVKEDLYTRIAPGQTHRVGLTFETRLDSKISGETNATVTMTFLNLDNGNVRRVAASPCAVMNVGN